MENQTPFDLNRTIQQWRQHLEQSAAFQRADLEELESHLRDSLPPLQSAGLSAEEAFLISVGRDAGKTPDPSRFAAYRYRGSGPGDN
jgi:hypothetical protein